MTTDALINALQSRLTPGRFYHTLGTFETAVALALRHGAPVDKAMQAALLHDCARQYSAQEQRQRIGQWSGAAPEDADAYPQLWHAWLAAEVARREYGIVDADVAAAIRVHSSGAPDMSLLAEVLFVADCVEPLRDYPEVVTLRITARQHLRRAVLECLEMKQRYVLAKGRPFHPDALRAIEYYRQACRNLSGA